MKYTIVNTLKEAEILQQLDFERSKALAYENSNQAEKANLDVYYKITKNLYQIQKRIDGKFVCPIYFFSDNKYPQEEYNDNWFPEANNEGN